jgi:predicted ATPase/DNA-binding SARP family transcriptional activator
MDSQCSIELFGGIRVEQGKRVITRFRTQKTASLIAYLAYFGDRMHAREVLIDMLWPGATSSEAGRTSLSVALSSLRSQLEPPEVPAHSLLLADRQSVGLSSLVVTDTSRFEKVIREAERARSRQDRDEEKRLLLTALALYRDKLLPGFYDPWIESQQGRLAEQYRIAVRRLSSLYEEDGDLDAAIACAQRAVQSDPSDEEVSQDLIRLLLKNEGSNSAEEVGAGASATAVKHYRQLERALGETGHAPSAKTRALVAPLLTHSPAGIPSTAPKRRRRSRLAIAATSGASGMMRDSSPLFSVASLPAKRTAHSVTDMKGFQHALAPSPDPLPVPLTRFFGRQEEIDDITYLLESGKDRLITLTGPGGTGKTRIALEIARQQRQLAQETQESNESGEQGESEVRTVYFISLIEAVTVELFIAALRSALGVREDQKPGADPLLPLIRALKDRHTLLILDNFEQIAEKGGELLERLMERAPHLTCLVTSRQRLPILGEREVPIAPLSTLPPTSNFAISTNSAYGSYSGYGSYDSESDISTLLEEQPAVALFVDRAQHARPDFQINRRNAASIVELVHRLEGIPLAIELAAARTPVLMPRQMLDRMGKRLDLLVYHRKVSGGRHQSLRDTLQFSYDLLSPQLKTFLTVLALFRGGFTAEAAEAVTESPIALDLLIQLRDASLLRGVEQESGEMRFQMLETVREFASEKQKESDHGREQHLQGEARHLAFYAQFAEEIDNSLASGQRQSENLDLLEADHDNFRAALRRVLRSEPDSFTSTESLRLIASLHNFWMIRGHLTEGREWDQQYWQRLRADKQNQQQARTSGNHAAFRLDLGLLAKAINGAGVLAMSQGDYSSADHCYRFSLWMRRNIGDRRGIAATLNNAGISRTRQEDWTRGRSLHERSLKEWRLLGEHRMISRLVGNIGIIAAIQGDYESARKHFQESLDTARRFGETRGITIGLCNLGHTYYKLGDLARAETLLTESLNVAYGLKDQGRAASALLYLGFVRSARVSMATDQKTVIQAELETGPQFLRIALESHQELNIPLAKDAIEEMEHFPAAVQKANGFPYSGLKALQDVLERWLPEHGI